MSDYKEKEVKRIKKWETEGFAPPLKLNLRVTEKCNLNCLTCERGRSSNSETKSELSKEKLLSVVDEGAEMGVEFINIDGSGEPFIRKDTTLDIMERAKDKGMEGHIVTNGTLLERSDLKRIVEMRWDKIQVSLDGPDARTHDYLRQTNGAYYNTLRTLKDLNEIKNECKTNKPRVDIATVLTEKNFKKIPEMVELTAELGFKGYNLQLLQRRTPESETLKLNKVEERKFQEYIKATEEIISERDIETDLSPFKNKELLEESFELGCVMEEGDEEKRGFAAFHCHLPWLYIGIRENGDINPCFQIDQNVKNVKNTHLSEVWTSSFFQNIRKSIKDGSLMRPCKKCCGSQVLENKKLKEILEESENETA